tara:strand:- start:80469 stop:81356 length:888 start_codon:yes stop_codon:yes gene_type:complete
MIRRGLGLWLALVFFPAVADIRVVDDAGVAHVLSKPAQRIVTLMPHASELLFAVGAGAQIVGAVDYSDYPAGARDIPRVGGYSGLNIEAIMALNPDLIIAWPEGNNSRDLARLEQLGFELYASGPQTFDDIVTNLASLGRISGHAQQGKQAADDFRQTTAALKARYQHKTRLSVFYQVWHEPLLTQNGSTFISRAIELCGGRNIFADLAIAAPQVSIEAVLAKNPQVIVASGMGESRPEWLDGWRRYKEISAVRTDSLYHIHPDIFHRPTPRFLQGTRILCEDMEKTRQRLNTLH